MATCPPVVDDKVCKNNKFSSTGETKVSSFSKPAKLPRIPGSIAVQRSNDTINNSEIYVRISSTNVVEYKVITYKILKNLNDNKQYERKQSQWKRTLREIRNDSSLSIFTIGDIEELINKARTEINNFLSRFIPSGSGGSTPVAISGQTSQRPTTSTTDNQNVVGTTPRTGSNQSTVGEAGQTGPTSQAGGAGISGASGASALDSLQDTGYLNTSRPKDYPITDQPGGTYKPLSDTSRFVFEKADSFNEKDALGDFSTEKESQEVGKRFPNTNRKYFGANLAVLNKLESTDFVSSYTKPDYIAYLIPYGSPALASNQTNTTSVGFVPEDNKKILENTILASPVENISKLSPKGKELYQSSYIILQKKNGNTESLDSLNKKAEAEWVRLINEKKTESILLSINSIYDDKNYKSFENQINSSTKVTKPKDYKNIISDLKRYFDSYRNSKFESRPFNLGTTPQDLIGLSNKAKENNFLGLAAQTLPKDLKYDVSKAISGLSADPFNISNTTDPGTKGVDPGLKVWQFLYNPQSITIDVKADYAESNTWGATDDGQSGRSVQWLRNQNPVMRLDEVVLNGFIHNKKVGQLEEGLFALLMSRDGPGQIQPTVWEFVWGKRRFGPCVINNIQVVERQWEAGEVLTATVSFELTQIPKWQIIDSTVKFYDPEAFAQFAATGTPGASGAGGGTTPGGAAPETPTTPGNRPGGGGNNDPCRSVFNNIIDGARSKSLSSYLFTCSKKTNPPIDLYKEIVTSNNPNGQIENILSRLNAQCNSYEGGKTPIINTPQQGEEYKTQGRTTLKVAYREAIFCKRQKENKNIKVSPRKINSILDGTLKGSTYKNGSFFQVEDYINSYEYFFKELIIISSSENQRVLANNVANNLKNAAGRDSNLTSTRFLPKTLRDRYSKAFGPTLSFPGGSNALENFYKEIRRLFQGLWLYTAFLMSKKNFNIPIVSGNKISAEGDFYIELVLNTNKVPIGASLTTGSNRINSIDWSS